jgi:hypothetical protein
VRARRLLQRLTEQARHRARQTTGHRFIRSFEPGESWFWDFETNDYYDGPELAGPQNRPLDQTSPGPAERVPHNWRDLLR